MSSVIRGEIVHFVPQSFQFASIGALGSENEVQICQMFRCHYEIAEFLEGRNRPIGPPTSIQSAQVSPSAENA